MWKWFVFTDKFHPRFPMPNNRLFFHPDRIHSHPISLIVSNESISSTCSYKQTTTLNHRRLYATWKHLKLLWNSSIWNIFCLLSFRFWYDNAKCFNIFSINLILLLFFSPSALRHSARRSDSENVCGRLRNMPVNKSNIYINNVNWTWK